MVYTLLARCLLVCLKLYNAFDIFQSYPQWMPGINGIMQVKVWFLKNLSIWSMQVHLFVVYKHIMSYKITDIIFGKILHRICVSYNSFAVRNSHHCRHNYSIATADHWNVAVPVSERCCVISYFLLWASAVVIDILYDAMTDSILQS